MNTVNIIDYAAYICVTMLIKGFPVSPLKLQKILYYQQSWHMVSFGPDNTLFDIAPQAWVNGPVYPVIYYLYKNAVPSMCDHLNFSHLSCTTETASSKQQELLDRMQLTADEIDLTDRVIMLYGSRSQSQLILLTHSEKPWSEMREGLQPFEQSEREMSLKTMYDYYKERYDRNRAKK